MMLLLMPGRHVLTLTQPRAAMLASTAFNNAFTQTNPQLSECVSRLERWSTDHVVPIATRKELATACAELRKAKAASILCEGCYDLDGTLTRATSARLGETVEPVCDTCRALNAEATV